uniref:Capsule assembly protein Wzi n=1 Tax=Gracilinema caldarium TaxID=215591 RepID=A0A7C3IIA7_9SPIR
MHRRLFVYLGNLFFLLCMTSLVAQAGSNGPVLTCDSKTTATPWSQEPALVQQTDISLSLPQTTLFIPLPRLRLYTLHNTNLDASPLKMPELFQSKALGLGIYAPHGQYRFLYGALTITGLEGRLQNLWDKAFVLPERYTKAGADLLRTTSPTQQQDMAGFLSIPIGSNSALYSLLHSYGPESIHGTIGFEIFHIDESTLRMEAGLGSHLLPETTADTWFASAPLLPQRQHYGTSISLQWFSPLLNLAGDMAASYTPWEGTGYYWKGAFAIGPSSFRISGGFDTIQGPFRDSRGELQVLTSQEEKNRGRLQLFIRKRNLGSLLINSELRFRKEKPSSPYYIDESTSALTITKGRLFRAWWVVPETFQLGSTYKTDETLPYGGRLSLTHRAGGTKGWVELKSTGSILSSQAQFWSMTAYLKPTYALEALGGMQFGSTDLLIGTKWKKEYGSPQETFINLKGDYKKDSFRLSGAVNLPIGNSADCIANLSISWTW